jgi:hypothetical protein
MASSPSPAHRLLQFGRECLTIVGWVAMWRPIQRRRVYLALGRAQVHVAGPAKP